MSAAGRATLRWLRGLAAVGAAGSCALALALPIHAAEPASTLAWSTLTPAQRAALKPLEGEWATIGPQRRQKWVEVAGRFDRMAPADRERVQQRMTEWVRMSPAQRNEARLNFQDAKGLSREERQARWDAYQALPEDQRKGLAQRGSTAPATGTRRGAADRAASDAGKLNVVPSAASAYGKPRAVAPALVQANPGATTNTLVARPAPPAHQPAGLPKVAATPEFVDARTLLPKRGPQKEATGTGRER